MNTRSTLLLLRFALGLVLLCGLVLGDMSPAHAALRCYVKWNASGANTGTSWADAYNSLQSALGTSSCTEVWVAKGTYRPTSSTDRTVSFVLESGAAIYGGFAGSETLLTQRDPTANPTILSGDIGASGNADNSYHVVVGTGTDNTALLDGFTITSGNADGSSWPNYVGGGLHNYLGSPSLANVIFTNNSATSGGGMYNDSNPSLTNVAFINNSATSGGGMFNLLSSPALTSVTFSGNSADQGGGVYNYESSPTLTNVTFSGNSAAYAGGGMNNYQSSPILVNVTFSGNSAAYGGGMFNGNSNNPTITNSILYGDTGGELYNDSSSPTVSYSIIQDGYPGTGNLDADPLLGSLQDNGGFTHTMALGAGSPAIEAGNDAVCPLTDQRGVTRPQDPHCDIGAFEFDQFVPPEVLSIQRTGPNPTDAASVDFTVTFTEPVTGVDTASPFDDFALTTSGVSGASVLAASGSGAVYAVTVNTGTGNGTIRLDVVDDDTIRNATTGTRPLGGEGTGNGDYTAGQTYTVMKFLRCYVKANAGGQNNGTSWANAYISLQSALGTSLCTEVWVARGTYKPASGTDRTISFALISGVSLYGGFAGTEALLTERNPVANPTILSGNIGGAGNSDNSYHVVVGSGTDSTALLDGFTITAGNADGTVDEHRAGGGMYSEFGSPSLTNVTFSSNSASSYGGGMFNIYSSSPSLTNVTLSGNSANAGGGISNFRSSSPSLTNVTFSGNSASAGGGMSNSTSDPSLANVTFSGNSASSHGGGMDNHDSSSPIIMNCILHGDTGGEISGDTATVSYSIVQGGYTGTGNLNANPLLGPLANNGGFTKTRALGFGSPAIDSGTNTGCPAKDQRGMARPQDGDGNGTAICDMGAYEAPANLSVLSAGIQDGWILESTETSGVGGTMNASQGTFALGDDGADRQGRSILSFNTAGLPDDAVLASVTLKIRGAGTVGTNPFTTHGNVLIDVRKGAFSGSAALQLQDFQAPAHKTGALVIKNNPVGGWYSGTMGAANFRYINKGGVTQFRLRFAKDDNDDLSLDYIKFYSGNSVLANWPQLIIRYYVP